jgi:hypothetical protein
MAANSIGINVDSQKIIENFKTIWITITIVVLAVLLIILMVRAISRRLRILIEKKLVTRKLSSEKGLLHYIPNSEIKVLSNKTTEWERAVVNVGVHYKENTDKVVEVLNWFLMK